jgi:ABC-type dipeptide/oligopeptide/nickel transport system permease component
MAISGSPSISAVALPTTLELVAGGLVLGIVLGIVCGMAMFAGRGTPGGQLFDAGSTVVMSVPECLWAILPILGIGVGLGLLPFIGRIDPQTTVPAATGFLLVDTLLALRLCSRVLVMHRGEIVEDSATEQIFAAPRHAYTRSLLTAVPPDALDKPWPPDGIADVAFGG